MYKFFILLIILVLSMFSCKTTTEPIKYDKNIEKADKEAELIHILIRNGNLEEAEKQIDKNLILYPDYAEIVLLKGWLYLKSNKLDESEKIFSSLLQKNKKNALAATGLAVINRIKGNKQIALKYISDALKYLPGNSNLWLEKGILEYEENNFKTASQYFDRAHALDNKNIEASFYKYITLLQLGKEIHDIYNLWENILKRKELLHSWFFQYHAEILYNKNKKSLAFQVIKNGLEEFPKDSYLLNMHSFYLYKEYLLNNKKELIDDAMKNILICIENSKEVKPEFIDTYLLILETTGDNEKLIKEVKKYYLLFPDNEIIIKWAKKLNI